MGCHRTVGHRRDHLTQGLRPYITHGKNTGDAGSRGFVGQNIAAAVHLQLALQDGYIVAGESTEASLPGVYAVGDVRTKALRQVVTAVADGAVAVHMAEEDLAGQ